MAIVLNSYKVNCEALFNYVARKDYQQIILNGRVYFDGDEVFSPFGDFISEYSLRGSK